MGHGTALLFCLGFGLWSALDWKRKSGCWQAQVKGQGSTIGTEAQAKVKGVHCTPFQHGRVEASKKQKRAFVPLLVGDMVKHIMLSLNQTDWVEK